MANKADSENRETPQTLDEDQARYKALLDSALDCIIWTNERGQIEEFNSAAERTFRISRAHALGRDLAEAILPSALRPHLRSELFASVAASGFELVGTRLETKVVRADSSEFPAELTVTSTNIKGRTSFIVYVRDITARRLAEQSLVRLAAIVESSQDAIVGTDLHRRITSWNKGAEMMYGYASAEVIGQDISILAPADRVDETVQTRNDSLVGHSAKSFETVRIAKGGRRLDVSLNISTVVDSDGLVVGTSAIGRDITAYKQTQDALRKASETSIYASPLPIIAVDRDRRVTMWNPAAESVFGWTEAEVMGKPNPVTLRGGTEEAAALHKRALAGETLTGIEVHGKKKDGAFVALSLSATPLLDENHKTKGIIGFLNDITEAKRAEEELRRAEEKYRNIFENAIEGIYQTTPQGGYISANPALARMLGFDSPAELIRSRTNIRNQGYVDPEAYEEFVSTMRQHDSVRNFEYRAYRKDGKVIRVSENAHVVRGNNRQLSYFEGTVEDVTEQRELEQQLQQMQKIEAVGRLAGGVAHDFNNLLMAISSYAELLQARLPESDTGRKYLGEIERVIERGAALTQGLLTVSRKQVLSPKILDLNKAIAEHIRILRRVVPENVELTFIPGDDLGRVKADPSQVEQVVMNLVINARDAMPDGGQLAIETCNCEIDDRGTKSSGLGKPGHVMIAVSDNGCGMDEKTRGQIFEPFFTTKAQGKGTGLGLAIVSDIVKQSGGQIFVQSEAGLGTTFKVCLPRVDGATQDHIAGPEESSVDGHETILLVEDEQTVRDSTAEYLEQHGYAVIKANGGPQALSLANHIDQPIHLMLTDVIMPQMSGRDLAEKIMEIHPETKIVFISGYSSNLLSNRQVLDPRHVLLQKPIRLSFLGKRLREILDHTNGASAGK